MNTTLFSLSDDPFISEETVISVFKRKDGEVFVECAEQLQGYAEKLSASFGENVLSSEARLFSYNYAITELEFYTPIMPSENCGKLIVDTVYTNKIADLSQNNAVRLTGDEIYPHELEDIKLGADNGYVCFGILDGDKVVSAAYTFLPLDDIDAEVEIGVETIASKRGRGYAAECVEALASFLNDNNIEALYSYYDHNIASAALAKRCGFEIFAEGFEITLERSKENAI